MKLNKSAMLTIGLVALLCLLFIVGFFLGDPSQRTNKNTNPSPTPESINPEGDMVLFENEKFRIMWIPTLQKYLISLKPLFVESQQEAEAKFLEIVGASLNEACGLKVEVVEAKYVKPGNYQEFRHLSFCPQPTPLSSLNPNLTSLSVEDILPSSGTINAAGTRYGIVVDFSQAINLSTAKISSTPEFSLSASLGSSDKSKLLINPDNQWQEGETYTITISKGLRSTSGQAQLKEDVVITYTIAAFELPQAPFPL